MLFLIKMYDSSTTIFFGLSCLGFDCFRQCLVLFCFVFYLFRVAMQLSNNLPIPLSLEAVFIPISFIFLNHHTNKDFSSTRLFSNFTRAKSAAVGQPSYTRHNFTPYSTQDRAPLLFPKTLFYYLFYWTTPDITCTCFNPLKARHEDTRNLLWEIVKNKRMGAEVGKEGFRP